MIFSSALLEIMLAEGNASMTVDDLVKALRPRGRASVPDNIKAELLSKLRAHIVS
jgi:enhancer of yellow 2 transcription factor